MPYKWSTDIPQAYLQSAEKLQRNMFCKPDGIALGKHEFLQLLLPLHGLSDSGEYWSETLQNHSLDVLGFEQYAVDVQLFFKREGQTFRGVSTSYVDVLLRAALPEERVEMEQFLKTFFDCKESKELSFDFLGMQIAKTKNGFAALMKEYILRVSPLPTECSFKEFSALRASLLWVSHCRPDVSAFVSMIASITAKPFEEFKKERVKAIDK